jgi:hypothetical protein
MTAPGVALIEELCLQHVGTLNEIVNEACCAETGKALLFTALDCEVQNVVALVDRYTSRALDAKALRAAFLERVAQNYDFAIETARAMELETQGNA